MWEAGGATRPLQGVISTDRMATRSPKGTLPASAQMSSQNIHPFISFFSLYWIIANTQQLIGESWTPDTHMSTEQAQNT